MAEYPARVLLNRQPYAEKPTLYKRRFLYKLDTPSTKIAVPLTGTENHVQPVKCKKSDYPRRNLHEEGWNKVKELYGCGFMRNVRLSKHLGFYGENAAPV